MSGNKARYYGLATKEDIDAVTVGSGNYTSSGNLTYDAVATAIRRYKANHPNFDELATNVAATRIASELNSTGLYGNVSSQGNRIVSSGYSVALTHGRGTNGMITINRASERVGEQKKRKRR